MGKLQADDKKLFERLNHGPASLPASDIGLALPEPHPAWMTRITRMWLQRYASQ
jgi:putative thiamine transport system substrate-binding protein